MDAPPRPVPQALARLLLALAAALAAGCATTGPGAPVGGVWLDGTAGFAAFQSFDFVPAPAVAPARVSPTMAYFGIEGVLASELSAVGLARSISGSPDVLVAYYQGGSPVTVDVYGYTLGNVNPGISIAGAGTDALVVDVVDARAMRLVWRGVAPGALTAPPALAPAVQQMLQGWPRPMGR